MKVSQTEPIKKLQAFAEANQQTQGKFTIGDEKVTSMKSLLVGNSELTRVVAPQRIHACPCRSIPCTSHLSQMLTQIQDPEIQKVTGKTKPVDVMSALREMKNSM